MRGDDITTRRRPPRVEQFLPADAATTRPASIRTTGVAMRRTSAGVVADIDHRHAPRRAAVRDRAGFRACARRRARPAARRAAAAAAASAARGRSRRAGARRRRACRAGASSRCADVEQLDDARRAAGVVRQAAHAAAVIEIVRDRQMRKQPAFLEHVADAAPVRRHVDARRRSRTARRRRARCGRGPA